MKVSNALVEQLEKAPKNDPRLIVRDFWAAVERRDLREVGDFISDEMTWEVMYIGHLMPGGNLYQGKQVIVEELLPFVYQVYPSVFKFEITGMYRDGDTVVMEFSVNAVTARGRPYEEVKYISIIKVEKGKIASAREYLDSLKAKTAHFD